MRPLSLAALTVLELSPIEMVRCAAACGYSHVGLRLVAATPNDPRWDSVGDTPLVRELDAALRDSGVQLLDIEILRLEPETLVADFMPVLETGARLGARHVLVAGNDPDESRTVARLAALADLAAPLRLSPCLEPMPWTHVRDFTQAWRVVQATGSDNVGVLVDAIHFDRGGNLPQQLRGVPPSRLPYMQLCDAPATRPDTVEGLLQQARLARLPPGEGGLDLVGLLRAMPPDIPLSLEVPLADTSTAQQRAQRVYDATRRWLHLC